MVCPSVNPRRFYRRLLRINDKSKKIMKWLTLQEIKQQLRIEADYTDEDALLTRYGNSAEAVVLNITGRTYEELVAMNPSGEDAIPADIWEATALLVTMSYEHRSAVSMQNLYSNPAFDMKIRHYVRLATKEESV
jgi:hypothetical protein